MIIMGLILRSMVSSPKKQAPRLSLSFIEKLLSFPEVSLFERRTFSQTRQGNTSRLHGSDFFPSRKITHHCVATNTCRNLCNIMTVDIYRNTLRRRTLSMPQRSHALHLNVISAFQFWYNASEYRHMRRVSGTMRRHERNVLFYV